MSVDFILINERHHIIGDKSHVGAHSESVMRSMKLFVQKDQILIVSRVFTCKPHDVVRVGKLVKVAVEQRSLDASLRKIVKWRLFRLVVLHIFFLAIIKSLESFVSNDLSVVDVVLPASPAGVSQHIWHSLAIVDLSIPIDEAFIK